MSLKDILSLLSSEGLKSTMSITGIVIFILASLLQVSKININPWDWVFGWLGEKLNAKLNKRISDMDSKIDRVQVKLDEHIAESEIKDLQDTRRDILDFANACMNGRKHTKEQFDFVIKECDDYETYIERKDIKNGVVESAIREIRRLNDKCIQTNSFLKEREYN